VCKQEGVVCGFDVVALVFSCVDPDLRVEKKARDGERVNQGTVVATVEGRLASILRGERTALNLLGRFSGIATLTRRFVDAVRDVEGQSQILILDTRKTTPLWRDLEKKAVLAGGGTNHRMGLYDAVLIKDNHIDACGGIVEAIQKVRERNREAVQVGVEARSLDDVRAAANENVDYILVDNMTPDDMREAVKIAGEIPVEASGGINLENVRAIAQTGVRRISIGALTHSAPALDFSLQVSS
jgi:nicotinate-nucleotide pyrophosphorylase (carboxylating)